MTDPSHQQTDDSNCSDSVRWVSQLRDGELCDTDRQRLDAHLAICPRCQVARRQFDSLFMGLDSLLARRQDS